MTELQKETEKQILDAARKVFIKKGLDGARMQEIADEAGINKALLHYYFRSKDKLFEMIFQEELGKFFPRMVGLMASTEIPFEEKIRGFVNNYINVFINNPFLPSFIIRELHRDPEYLQQFFIKSGFNVETIGVAIKGIADQLNISPDEARSFMINMVSICIFPFAGRPLIERILFENNHEEYDKFLEQRKTSVVDFILSTLKKN